MKAYTYHSNNNMTTEIQATSRNDIYIAVGMVTAVNNAVAAGGLPSIFIVVRIVDILRVFKSQTL